MCLENKNIILVLMDLSLPDMDGYSATAEIKKLRPELPVIVQSANAMPEHKDLAKQSGADDFLEKPLKKEDLYTAVSKWIAV
jgi:CheY-like chemotaxis protein